MSDQLTNKSTLEKKHAGVYNRLIGILNKYDTNGHSYLIHRQRDVYYILDEADSNIGFLDLTEALQRSVELLQAYLEHLGVDTEYIKQLRIGHNSSNNFAGHATYQEYLQSTHWQKLRVKAIKRADGCCMLCNTDEEPLHVHHRTYERLGKEEPMDVIVLCATHHALFHGRDGGK